MDATKKFSSGRKRSAMRAQLSRGRKAKRWRQQHAAKLTRLFLPLHPGKERCA